MNGSPALPLIEYAEAIDGRSHDLPDEVLGAKLVAFLEDEANGRSWTAAVVRSNGTFHLKLSQHQAGAFVKRPSFEQTEYMRMLCLRLNREMANGGAWVCAWFDDACWGIFWKDSDGDIQFAVENEEPWARTRRVPHEKWMQDADAAWHKWFLLVFQVVGVDRSQMHRKALGEPAPKPARNDFGRSRRA